MNKTNIPMNQIKIGLSIALLAGLAGLTGCVGYVDGGGYGYGDAVVVGGPEVGFYGGGYERGRDVHDYSHRGSFSRSVAHPGGGGGGGRGGKR
jgi:hypothetical protein